MRNNYKTAQDFNRGSQIVDTVQQKINSNQLYKTTSTPTPYLSMTYNNATVESLPPFDPKVWGPSFWFVLHKGAAKYPIKATPVCASRMKGFILGIPFMVPCEKCADHATAYINERLNVLDDVVSGRDKLFNFFVDFHNYVNLRYDKPLLNYEEAYKLYTTQAIVKTLDQYKMD